MNVKIYSRKDFFKSFKLTEDEVEKHSDYFICINATANLHSIGYFKYNHKNVLNLYFDDVPKDMLKTFGPNEEYICYARSCKPEQAIKILKFIKAIPQESTVHIYCTKGKSRSVAIGNFIRKYYNNEDINTLGHNEHVYKLLEDYYNA